MTTSAPLHVMNMQSEIIYKTRSHYILRRHVRSTWNSSQVFSKLDRFAHARYSWLCAFNILFCINQLLVDYYKSFLLIGWATHCLLVIYLVEKTPAVTYWYFSIRPLIKSSHFKIYYQLCLRAAALTLFSARSSILFWSPLLVCKARSPNTLRTPRFCQPSLIFNISLIDRSLANGLQTLPGERYTRKIPCAPLPPTVPNPQRRYAGYWYPG